MHYPQSPDPRFPYAEPQYPAGQYPAGQYPAGPPGYYDGGAVGMTEHGPRVAGQFAPGAYPPGPFAAAPDQFAQPAQFGYPAQHGSFGPPPHVGQPGPHAPFGQAAEFSQPGQFSGGAAGNPRSGYPQATDADPDRVLTPTTIYAPGSLVNPPGAPDGDGHGPVPPAAGPGVAGPGYAAPPGYPPFPGYGSVPPGGFQAPAGHPGYAPYQAQQSAQVPGAFPGPGGFSAPGGQVDGAAYGPAGYPPPGYGPPPGGQFPGPVYGQEYPGQPPSQQFPGQPPMPSGHGYDHRADPRPPAYGWHDPDAFPPPGEARQPDGQPFQAGLGQAGHGPAGPRPMAYPPPGYPGQGASPGPHGFRPAHGFSEPPGQAGYQAGYQEASGFAGAGGQAAPYPQYQAYQPYGGPGGYRGPAGPGGTLHGGAYAYVIHEDDPAPSRPYAGARGEDHGEWPPGPAPSHPAAAGPAPPARSGQPAGPGGQARAITAGQAVAPRQPAAERHPAPERQPGRYGPAETTTSVVTPPRSQPATAQAAPVADEPGPAGQSVPDVAPEQMYGPDDPAYGPPGPDWYKRGEERALAADGVPQADAGEQPAARGPFEPLRSGDAGYQPADHADGADGPLGDLPGPTEQETLDFLGLDTPTDPEAGTLGQVRDLYLAAEKISPDSLDRHFDQLLERQRKLISDYFMESSGPAGAAAPP